MLPENRDAENRPAVIMRTRREKRYRTDVHILRAKVAGTVLCAVARPADRREIWRRRRHTECACYFGEPLLNWLRTSGREESGRSRGFGPTRPQGLRSPQGFRQRQNCCHHRGNLGRVKSQHSALPAGALILPYADRTPLIASLPIPVHGRTCLAPALLRRRCASHGLTHEATSVTELSKTVSSLVLLAAGFCVASMLGPPELAQQLAQQLTAQQPGDPLNQLQPVGGAIWAGAITLPGEWSA